AAAVAGGAVRSCRTVSPLPPARRAETGWRCTFCGTFPGVAPAGRYPAPYLRGARTFLFPRKRKKRPSDRLAPGDLGCRSASVKGLSAFEEAGQAAWRRGRTHFRSPPPGSNRSNPAVPPPDGSQTQASESDAEQGEG